jgi:8-oxo-dGTP pyrophosphatase MutT (NUDIX family)
MSHTFKPSVTVAAIIERDGRFLLIEEETSEGIKLNQPAGHLDPLESLEQAVVREVMEETAHEFIPHALVGMYMSRYQSKTRGRDVTYLRFTFCGAAGKQYDQPLDHGILRTLWMTRDEMAACQDHHRSPIMLQCVDDYLAGKRSPLAMLQTHSSVFEGGLTLKTDVT